MQNSERVWLQGERPGGTQGPGSECACGCREQQEIGVDKVPLMEGGAAIGDWVRKATRGQVTVLTSHTWEATAESWAGEGRNLVCINRICLIVAFKMDCKRGQVEAGMPTRGQ